MPSPWLRGLLLALACAVADVSAADSGRFRLDGASYSKPRVDAAGEFFASGKIPFLRIDIAPDQLAELAKNNRAYVRATVTEDGIAYTDVGLHLKGAAGSFRPIDQKPALSLNFDRFVEGQNFHGLDKFHLNNSVQDGSFLSELICADLFNAAGVPSPRVSHAFVKLNGRELGLFVLKEGFDSVFLKKHFSNWFGTMYDGGFCQDLTLDKKIVSNGGPTDRADLKELIAASQENDAAVRRKRLEGALDMNRFQRFVAMEMMTSHWDGYCQNRNNYRMYHDPTTDRLVFFAAGMDQMFGDPNFPIVPGGGMVAQAMIRAPEDRQRYLEVVKQVYTNAFYVPKLTNRIDEVVARIKPLLATINTNDVKALVDQANGLKQRIIARGQGIQRQFQEPVKTLAFNNGIAKLPDFTAKVEGGNPPPAMDKLNEGGKQILRIRPNGDNSVASWRTRVVLANGRYSFEAQARVFGVAPGPDINMGAAIRISGGQRRANLTGNSPTWQKLEYEIQVNDATAEVELVCELRGNNRSQVWFDLASLRLVKK